MLRCATSRQRSMFTTVQCPASPAEHSSGEPLKHQHCARYKAECRVGGESGKKMGRIDGRWCCTAHHWRTGWPPLERTGCPRQAGLGPRNPQILRPQHCAGRVEKACGDLSPKYAAGRQPGAGGWESTGARGAAGSGGWPTFALTPTSQQTGPGQNQASYELEGARSRKSCSRTLTISRPAE